MKLSLNVIVDVSGSMTVMGKGCLQRNLCQFISSLKYFDEPAYRDIDLHFYQWAQDITELSCLTDGNIPAFSYGGSTNLNVLTELLLKHVNDVKSERFLILSDGHFQIDDPLFAQLQAFPKTYLQAVAIGSDANEYNLTKFVPGKKVFLPENISTAIKVLLFLTPEQKIDNSLLMQVLQTPLKDDQNEK